MTELTYTGFWSSTLVPYQVANGEIRALLDSTTQEAKITITYYGSHQSGVSWTTNTTVYHLEGDQYRAGGPGLILNFTKSESQMVGHYELNNDRFTDFGVFNLQLVGSGSLSNLVEHQSYYATYHGHLVTDLHQIYDSLKRQGYQQFIWLAGDSSLDNKYWLLSQPRKPAINGYQQILTPPLCVQDICYWLNQSLAARHLPIAAMMTAIEESTLAQRGQGQPLLSQDQFIQDHLQPNDYLVVSVGGNDIAFKPSLMTIVHLANLTLMPNSLLPYNPAFWYFVRMFRDDVTAYLNRLIQRQRPKKILVCMIYFPCEDLSQASWANTVLKLSRYNQNPEKLQQVIRSIYQEAVRNIQIEGVEIIPVALFEIMSSKDKTDYVHRVEPSITGGSKMADAFLEHILA